jgi:valyl-tRNA synthetase
MSEQREKPKPYSPHEHETRIYARWLESGYFTPENLPHAEKREPFTIIMPPPNATGTLHLGHALEYSFQDAVIRYQRMRGKKALWLPGTDHAAIATNTKVEKILMKEEGKNRHDIGRNAFVKKVEAFVADSRSVMREQIRRMGASADWSREAFTMDEPRSRAVRTAFKTMYDAGLIYRAHRVINWDPKGQTAISDDEVEHKTENGTLYIFRYSADFPIPIATTRPETKLGDTAVAVHPKDERYRAYVGKTYTVDFAGRTLYIAIVADDSVDPSYGTGAVGVTPAHSLTDADIAERHSLPMIRIINEYGRMTDEAGSLVAGKKTKEAREIVVSWLIEHALLEKKEDIEINISVAERSGGIIEPLPKLQWFVSVTTPFPHTKSSAPEQSTTLKEIMKTAVESGRVHIMPERFEKIYGNWINALRDWNISRQIWYGHRIPVWYCVACGTKTADPAEMEQCLLPIVSVEDSTECPHCGGIVEQDPDTLDTWFSSALWTFSTLGWPPAEQENASPKKNAPSDLTQYHPTSLMNPGYELIFFWVARMILMSGFLLGEVPFKLVYFHGILRDSTGRKFSKSLDNGIEPLDVIRQYGADALRMSLVVGISPGSDSNFDINKVKGYKNFANKIWNASRFALSNLDGFEPEQEYAATPRDEEIIAGLKKHTAEITAAMETYRLYVAAEKLYHYFWHTFADTIIEEMKPRLKTGTAKDKKSAQHTLYRLLVTQLKLLHPFMPFVTEVLWEQVPQTKKNLLMIEEWPQ